MSLPITIPEYVTLEWMDKLGYELIVTEHSKPEKGYFKYGNKPGHTANDDYGVMPLHKRIVYFNCTYYSDIINPGVFCCIQEDGGTRSVFNGVIQSADDFIRISAMVR